MCVYIYIYDIPHVTIDIIWAAATLRGEASLRVARMITSMIMIFIRLMIMIILYIYIYMCIYIYIHIHTHIWYIYMYIYIYNGNDDH